LLGAAAAPPAAESKRYDVIIASAGVPEDLALAQLIHGRCSPVTQIWL